MPIPKPNSKEDGLHAQEPTYNFMRGIDSIVQAMKGYICYDLRLAINILFLFVKECIRLLWALLCTVL